jgi:hypothetical protein
MPKPKFSKKLNLLLRLPRINKKINKTLVYRMRSKKIIARSDLFAVKPSENIFARPPRLGFVSRRSEMVFQTACMP